MTTLENLGENFSFIINISCLFLIQFYVISIICQLSQIFSLEKEIFNPACAFLGPEPKITLVQLCLDETPFGPSTQKTKGPSAQVMFHSPFSLSPARRQYFHFRANVFIYYVKQYSEKKSILFSRSLKLMAIIE